MNFLYTLIPLFLRGCNTEERYSNVKHTSGISPQRKSGLKRRSLALNVSSSQNSVIKKLIEIGSDRTAKASFREKTPHTL